MHHILQLDHMIGGCCMGKDRNNGVVNNFGRVYKGTGATLTDTIQTFTWPMVPTSLGVNSSLTISALAFRKYSRFSKLPSRRTSNNGHRHYLFLKMILCTYTDSLGEKIREIGKNKSKIKQLMRYYYNI